MTTVANLNNTSPQELKRMLDSVKVSNLTFEEKEYWVTAIQAKLGIVTRDPIKEKKLIAEIEAGQADIDDLL